MRKIKPKVDEFMGPSSVGLKKEKSKPVYPMIRLDLQHIPEAKDWKVGNQMMIELKVKMVGLSQGRFDQGAEFEIHEIDTETLKAESKEVEEKE